MRLSVHLIDRSWEAKEQQRKPKDNNENTDR